MNNEIKEISIDEKNFPQLLKEIKNPSKYVGNELEYLKKVLSSETWSATSGNWNQTLGRNANHI